MCEGNGSRTYSDSAYGIGQVMQAQRNKDLCISMPTGGYSDA